MCDTGGGGLIEKLGDTFVSDTMEVSCGRRVLQMKFIKIVK